MRKSLFLALGALALFFLVSCHKESGDTRIVYYPSVTLEGDSEYWLIQGEEYVEPGYTAILNGEDVTGDVVVTSTVDSDECGIYSVTYSYSYTTDYGYTASSSTSRTVYVYAEGDIPSGIYTTTADTYCDYNGTLTYYPGYTCTIICFGDYCYYVSDFMAGYYDQMAGYGSDYAMEGYMSYDPAANVFAMEENHVSGWGDSADDFYDAAYDSGTGLINWTVEYAGSLTFVVELSK